MASRNQAAAGGRRSAAPPVRLLRLRQTRELRPVAVARKRLAERVSAQTEVLIVKVGAIGDVVMAIPAAAAAREPVMACESPGSVAPPSSRSSISQTSLTSSLSSTNGRSGPRAHSPGSAPCYPFGGASQGAASTSSQSDILTRAIGCSRYSSAPVRRARGTDAVAARGRCGVATTATRTYASCSAATRRRFHDDRIPRSVPVSGPSRETSRQSLERPRRACAWVSEEPAAGRRAAAMAARALCGAGAAARQRGAAGRARGIGRRRLDARRLSQTSASRMRSGAPAWWSSADSCSTAIS